MKVRRKHLVTVGALVTVVLIGAMFVEQRRIVLIARRNHSAMLLSHLPAALAQYCEWNHATPPLEFHDSKGSPTISWRLAISNCFEASPQLRIDRSIRWDQPPNRAYSESSHRFFCDDSLSEQTTTKVFGCISNNSVFGRNNVKAWDFSPNLAIALWLETDCAHPWPAPGDVRLIQDELRIDDCVIRRDERFSCLAVFADGQVWEIRGTAGLRLLFRFADLDFAARNDRQKLKEQGCTIVWPLKGRG